MEDEYGLGNCEKCPNIYNKDKGRERKLLFLYNLEAGNFSVLQFTQHTKHTFPISRPYSFVPILLVLSNLISPPLAGLNNSLGI